MLALQSYWQQLLLSAFQVQWILQINGVFFLYKLSMQDMTASEFYVTYLVRSQD